MTSQPSFAAAAFSPGRPRGGVEPEGFEEVRGDGVGDEGDTGRVLVGGLRDLLPGETAQSVLALLDGEQALRRRGDPVGVGEPVRPARGELGPVPATRDHQGSSGHRGVVGPHERKVFDRERGEGVARAGRGDQDAKAATAGCVKSSPGAPSASSTRAPRSTPKGLGAPGVADDRDPAEVGAVPHIGRPAEDAVEAVQHGVEVGYPHAPHGGEARIVPADAVAAGVQVGGLDHDEPGGGPPVDEGLVPVHGPRVAVGEHDDGEVPAGHRGGDLHLEVHAPAGGGDGDRLDRDDRKPGFRAPGEGACGDEDGPADRGCGRGRGQGCGHEGATLSSGGHTAIL